MKEGDFIPEEYDLEIDHAKTRDYSLNLEHRIGGHKARLIEHLLGYTQEDYLAYEQFIRDNVRHHPISKVEISSHGTKYRVLIPTGATTRMGEVLLLTAWIEEVRPKTLRLTTSYIAKGE